MTKFEELLEKFRAVRDRASNRRLESGVKDGVTILEFHGDNLWKASYEWSSKENADFWTMAFNEWANIFDTLEFLSDQVTDDKLLAEAQGILTRGGVFK